MISKNELKRFASLSRKKHRETNGLFLVEGVRAVREVDSSSFEVLVVLHTKEFAGTEEGKALLGSRKGTGRVEVISSRDLSGISDTVNAQGVIAVVKQQHRSALDLLQGKSEAGIIVVADGVTDPGNLGSMIRTCDWFGVDGVVLGAGCVDLYNPKVIRGTMGSVFHVPVAEDVELVRFLEVARSDGFSIVATDAGGGDSVSSLHNGKAKVILFGNEAWGVSEPVRTGADLRVAIPRVGKAESLNVGTACGIVLAAARGVFGNAVESHDVQS